jgi:hypothetical protein
VFPPKRQARFGLNPHSSKHLREEFSQAVRSGVVEDFRRSTLFDGLALIHKHHAIGHSTSKPHLVGHKDRITFLPRLAVRGRAVWRGIGTCGASAAGHGSNMPLRPERAGSVTTRFWSWGPGWASGPMKSRP